MRERCSISSKAVLAVKIYVPACKLLTIESAPADLISEFMPVTAGNRCLSV